MARNYTNLPVLSKVKIGTQIYYLKDAEVRALLDTYGDAVTYNVDTTVTDGSTNLITSGAVHKYVNDRVIELTGGAMTFLGIKEELPTTGNPGDVVIVGTAEYVYADGQWHLYGDEGVYATVTGVEAAYVKKTLTIAGINLEDAITAEELKTALDLGALAEKDSASATLTDYATGIAGAEYTPAGSVAVALTQTATEMTATGNYTPAGTISAPTITVTPSTTTVNNVTSVGTLPSVTEVKSSFATEGLTAAVDATDTEMLVFNSASTSEALTETGFSAGTLPTLAEDGVTVMTGVAGASASAPTFTGTAAEISVAGSYDKAGVDDLNTKFTGTLATITPTLETGSKVITIQ